MKTVCQKTAQEFSHEPLGKTARDLGTLSELVEVPLSKAMRQCYLQCRLSGGLRNLEATATFHEQLKAIRRVAGACNARQVVDDISAMVDYLKCVSDRLRRESMPKIEVGRAKKRQRMLF